MPTRALITSGGGAKGAFTVGALNALADMGINHYDIISGTSTGALLSALSVLGRFSDLQTIYLSVNNDDILKKQNIVDNILNNRPFVYDTDPLLGMINHHITDEVFDEIMASPTLLCLTAISLQTGKITVFSTKNIPSTAMYSVSVITTREQLVDALLASSSQAGFLKPVSIETVNDRGQTVVEQFVDGGNRDVIPSRVVTDLAPDEIYVLSNNPSTLFPGDEDYSQTSVINVILRAISIFIQDVRENDLAVLEEYKERTNAKVFRIEPRHDLDPAHPTGLNFNRTIMTVWMGQGRSKANEVVTVADRPLRPF
jgi:NTE family protein